MAKTSTGIDVGHRTSKVLRGQYKGNTFHVSEFALTENRGGDLDDGWRNLGLPFKPTDARIGLTGRDVNIRYTRVPEVPDWQLRNLMRFEVAEIGDQSGSEVASDFNLLPQLPEVDGEDVVLLAMAREQMLGEQMEGLKQSGGTLDSFSPSAIALYNAWTHYGVVEEDTVLLANIGHDNIDVVISRGPDLLFARNLSGGGRLFDDAIAQRFNCSAEQAEKLKIDIATLEPGAKYETPNHERASRAILGAAGQLLSLLQSAILFCKSQVRITGLKVDRVLLCGGGSALDGLTSYLSSGMNVPVDYFDPFRVVDASSLEPEGAELLDEYKLEAVVALGLATMGSNPAAYSLEILPQDVAKKREFFGGTIWLIAAAVLGVAYLGFSAYQKSKQLDAVETENVGLARRVKDADRVHSATETLLDENEALAGLVDELQGVAGTGEQMARTMEFLDERLPDDFWLTELSSDWSHDKELRVERNYERPILLIRGRAREGTDSTTSQQQQMMAGLRTAMPDAAVLETFNQDLFEIDMTLFAPPPPPAEDNGDGEAEETN
ncbi:MAG: pilus assembly protein PilM [bacterium]|nr:pilus assembly protein PilM [bacterium]